MSRDPLTALEAPTLAAALDAAYRDHGPAAAIITPDGEWTYDDLATHAHTVAAAVRAAVPGRAVGPDHPPAAGPIVAVVLERSPEFVATLAGILAAGAVYLPLDPGAPDAYLSQIFTEARPAMIITSAGRAERLSRRTSVPVRTYPTTPTNLPDPSGDWPAGSSIRRPDGGQGDAPAPRDPAYVIYTSGSTGTPKGVVVPHQALLNSTAARADRYGPAGRVPLLHSPAFDLTSGVLFWTILSGGTLIIDPRHLTDVAATVELIHRHDVTHLIYPSSLYGAFLDRASHRPPTSLAAAGIGSERWSPALIDRHARLLPDTCLVNEYGPTEACVCSSYAVVYDNTSKQARPLSIGRPARNTGYLLVNSDRNPATGRGELAITGTNLALGYLHRADLTDQRFVTVSPGQRAYLTGDLVEQTSTGELVFVDRLDRQIQVGGHRVEPGHIETVLLGHPQVQQAHVTERQSGTGGSTLIAYLVPRPDSDRPDTDQPATTAPGHQPATGGSPQGGNEWASMWSADCDQYLKARVPAYLVPSAYVVLPELPRTPAGKIDQARLPDPSALPGAEADADQGAVADRLQHELSTAVADLLGVVTVPPDQPLSALGVSSLALVRLAGVIDHVHGVDVPISALFASSLRQITALVRTAAPSRRPVLQPAEPAEPGGTAGQGGTVGQAEAAEAVYGQAFPLSGQQHQIWVLTQMAPDALAYSTQFSLLLSGPLDIGAVEAALSHIIARHEILRTTFHDGPTGPIQIVHEPWRARVDLVDLTDLNGDAQHHELDSRMRSALGIGFDVATLPLVRWHLYRLGPQSWRLLQVEHHFAHDGWSAQLFLAELRDAYRAITAGQEPQLAALPVQYRDYATWYHQWRTSNDFADQVTYWRTRLDTCPRDPATFTPDRPRPATRTFHGDRLIAHIPPETVERLDLLAARCGVTRFAVFLSAFAVQVWQHTGQRDLVIGSAMVNRRQAGTETLLGMFVNALPLRLAVDPDATTVDLLHATMSTVLGAQDHQELPLLDLLAHLDVPRDPGRNPLFSLMFAFHDTPRPDFQIGPLTGQLVIEHNATAKNDLNVVCVPDPPTPTPGAAGHRRGISILWEYDSDLFDPDTAQALLTGFEHILRVLPQAPDRPVRDLDLLDASRTAQILAAGTGPADDPPFDTLSAGFAAAVIAHPTAVALEQGSSRWTYLELDAKIKALQQHLTDQGVRAGSVVAVACPPGVELVTAILATLGLGAVYVCLDPGQPPTRSRLMLDDAGAGIVITTHRASGHDTRWSVAGMPVLYADEVDGSPLGSSPASPPPDPDRSSDDGPEIGPEIGPDNRAYLVYTSGSTGTPKAVVATHRNACAAVHARTRHLATTGPQPPRPATRPRTLITLPAIFDVGASMMMWTLWSGGTIVLPSTAQQAQDPEQIRSLVERHSVTHVNFVASFYRHLLTTVTAGWGPSLQVVAIGGEACRPNDVREHAIRLPQVALDNEYGPTEATVWCSAVRLHPPQPSTGPRVSIGRPLANTFMVVLSPDGDVLPTGAAGELYIGGAGLAAGYHRRPDLTRQRFVVLPHGPLAGRRLYRTGDRARLSGGQFEIQGRLDDQVKIRGFRVELGEVTACLLQHSDLNDAAVVSEGDDEQEHLIAYVATDHPDRADPSGGGLATALRAWTAARLPAYMIPAAFVVTRELPRTPTGKLDRSRLRALNQGRSFDSTCRSAAQAAQRPRVADAPATDRQQRLLQVWGELLRRPDLGIDDDFFACGGDSLQAIRAAARARELGLAVTVTQLQAARTVRALDRSLNEPDEDTADLMPVADRRPAGTALALTPIQAWFFTQRFADPDHFHQARLFDLDETCDMQTLRDAVAWTLARHDAFRTQFTRPTGQDRTWGAILAEQPVSDMVTEQTLPGDGPAPARLAPVLQRLHSGLSIESGRLASITIIGDPSGPHRWLYAIAHHLIIDAVSWQVLVDDIEKAYRLRRAGKTLPAGNAPGIPTATSTAAAAAAADGGPVHADPAHDGSAAGTHWQNLAAAAKPVLRGPGPARPAAPMGERIAVERRLSAHTGRYLRHDAHRLQGVSALPVLLAALRRALAPFSDHPDLYVWLEGHGRTGTGSAELEGVIGWLTTLYPALLTATDTHPGRLIDTAADFQRQLAAIPDHGTGFARARYLHPESPLGRKLATIATPQVTVNYLGDPQFVDPHRMLRPAAARGGATIGAANVLPTPLDLTIATDPDGVVSCRFLIDPNLLSPDAAEQLADRFAGELEATARVVALTPAAVDPDPHTLFWIHPVGGGIDQYAATAHTLGPSWDCYALPHDASTDAATMPALARAYLDRLRGAKPTGPYILAGWSFGAVLAYEMARQAQLDPEGHQVLDLVLLDPPAATRQPADPPTVLVAHLQTVLPDQPLKALTDALNATADLQIPDRAWALASILTTGLGDEPGRPDQEADLVYHLQILLTCHAAMARWRPTGQAPRLRLILPDAGTAGLDHAGMVRVGRETVIKTWQARSVETLRLNTVPGGHHGMLAGPGLRLITAALRAGVDDHAGRW